MSHTLSLPSSSVDGDRRQYCWIAGFMLVLFVFIALATRPLPRRWRPLADVSAPPRSVLAEARAAVATYAPYAFMAY